MILVFLKFFSRQIQSLALVTMVIALALLVPAAEAQRSKGGIDQGPEHEPSINQFKGVRIGMATDEARKKLGDPRDKSAEVDLYMLSDNEVLQVYYDKGAVNAISIDFMSGASVVPTIKDVFGADAAPKDDGSIFKKVTYPKSGYSISYSRTAGTDATVSITMQRLQ